MSGERILLVDDEDNLRTMLAAALAHSRFEVETAADGREALAKVPKFLPDLILLDVMMPGRDGYSVMSRLREDVVTRDVPVIFVTAMETNGDEERGLAMGAVDYITKPIKPAILLARVRTQVALKQARDFLNDKNAYLEFEVNRRMEENQRIQNVSIRTLAHLAETRDPQTGDHILRTQSYIAVLSKRVQAHPRFSDTITDHYIQILTKSAPLHDIGKVGIPDHVLLKPGKLTGEEWEIMKTHAELGARAIEFAQKDVDQSVDFLNLAVEIAHWHHERWDGSGYPDALKGDAIPISARLMAVADVFDALISRRVYKPPIPFEEARGLIFAGRDSQFDPDIVDAFMAEFDSFTDISHMYQQGTDADTPVDTNEHAAAETGASRRRE